MPTEEITRDILGQELAQAEAEAEADGDVEASVGDIGVGLCLDLEGNGDLNSKDQGVDLALAGTGDDSGLDDERNNRDTVDDPNTQRLTWAEIEELKRKGGGSSGRVSRGSFYLLSCFFPSFPCLLLSERGYRLCIETRIPGLILGLGVCVCARGVGKVVLLVDFRRLSMH